MRLIDTSFFSKTKSRRHRLSWRNRCFGPAVDKAYGACENWCGIGRKLDGWAASAPRRRILLAGVARPAREAEMDAVVLAMRSLHHQIHVSIVPMGDRGKFENINAALAAAPQPLSDYDWIIVADDDIKLPARFLDMFIGACEASALQIAQPAHRYRSHWSWAITQRAWGSAVRQSRFVEIGPVTAFAQASFAALLPFPTLRWGWGLDLYWSGLASRHGLSMGIVDAVAIEHLDAPAGGYSGAEAVKEAEAFLRRHGVKVGAAELMKESRIVMPWRDRRPRDGGAK